jgi:predicted nucleotide-binding protein (sugar kinase/HSP70/actin superfamily)
MATVRIDDELLNKIKKWLDQNGNKYKYPSVSAFINNSIYEKLKKEEEKNV